MPETSITVDTLWWSAFLLMLARTGGWMLLTPLFGNRGFGAVGRSALSIALAVVLAGRVEPSAVPNEVGAFLFELIIQFALGAGFGFLTGILLQAPAVAGALADNLSGLGYAAVIDPASGQQVSVFGRLFSMTFLALLFGSGAYLTIINGFARSVEAFGVGDRPQLTPDAAVAMAHALTALLRAAFEVGAPLLGALLLTDVILGVGARFFPQGNITILGLGLKTLVAIAAAGTALVMLPGHIDGLVTYGETLVRAVLEPGGGG